MMSNSANITIRIDPKDKESLENLAKSTNQSKSYLAGESIGDPINTYQWQIEEIELAIGEADLNNFATDDETGSTFKKWK